MPALSPLAGGSFVNFESPQVKPLALSGDGGVLFATNTPNNRLTVLSTAGGLNVIKEVPVGLDPVTVAVQPGTNDQIVWVANFVSDNVSVVDVGAGAVLAAVEVGDEPVNVLFDPSGQFAFVVIQGIGYVGPDLSNPEQVRAGNVVVIDTATRQVVSTTFLDCMNPRAAAYDPSQDRLVVAALNSGNNTTVVGRPITLLTTDPPPANPNGCEEDCQCDCRATTVLEILRDFPPTATIFAATPGLGTWPDVHETPGFPESPKVHRIIDDPGVPGGWQSIIALLADGNGAPEPAMVAQMNQHFAIQNALEVIQVILDEAQDTVDVDLVVLSASDPANPAGLPEITRLGNVGTTLTGMARHPVSGALFVSNMQARNVTRLAPALRGHVVDHQVVVVSNAGGPIAISAKDLHGHVAQFDDIGGPNPGGQQGSVANPMDLVFEADGSHAYLAAFGPGRVASLNADTGRVIDRVDVGRGPRGLALDSAGRRLYVMNRTDLSITVVDVSNPNNLMAQPAFPLFNPEPAAIRDGRDFLYSTRFSNNFGSSCAVCHIDGNHDFLAWDLGSPTGAMQPGPPNLPLENHPLKGPMVTLSLRGLRDHNHLHWRSDKPAFQDFNEAFVNLLGAQAELTPEQMDAFTAFIETVVYPPNPMYHRDNSFKDEARMFNGGVLFVGNCAGCHQLTHDGALDGATLEPPVFTGDGGINVSGGNLFAQLQEVTQLRDIARKSHMDRFTGFGMIHDGREKREGNHHPLQTFLLQFFPESLSGIGPEERLDMIAFMNAFPANVMNVVGWQVLARAELQGAGDLHVPDSVVGDINVMIAQYQKSPSHCDVAAHGLIGGDPRGFFLSATEPGVVFTSDLGESMTLDALLALLGEADSLVFTAVPPGSGRRIGIDQDLDCLGDGLDPMPQANNAGDGDFDGHVGILDFLQLMDCLSLDGPVPPECVLYDSDCNGFLDSADASAFVSLYQDPQADCNANGSTDLLDVVTGTSLDADRNGIPDECLSLFVESVASRYIKVQVSGTEPTALRVTSPMDPCLFKYVNAEGYLVSAPVVRTPAEWGAVYVGDSPILPSSSYAVQVEAGGVLSQSAAAATWAWGEVNGVEPVDVGDIVCALDAFAGVFVQCSLFAVDLMPQVPDRNVDVAEILAVLDAFAGLPAPYEEPCP
jgi:YVTN family beta-propeller protein